jgi:hypothetical protein
MDISCNVSVPVAFKSGDIIVQKRREQHEQIFINSGKNIEEVERMQQMTVGE